MKFYAAHFYRFVIFPISVIYDLAGWKMMFYGTLVVTFMVERKDFNIVLGMVSHFYTRERDYVRLKNLSYNQPCSVSLLMLPVLS